MLSGETPPAQTALFGHALMHSVNPLMMILLFFVFVKSFFNVNFQIISFLGMFC